MHYSDLKIRRIFELKVLKILSKTIELNQLFFNTIYFFDI